ncbi:MAG: DinB family protein [Saprospiraceae bacterium]|nr:DinB family protein [Saprospiraceae bacterium]
MQRPQANEHRDYFLKYIQLVPEGDIIQLTKKNTEITCDQFRNFQGERENYRYAPEKWTVKEMLLHIIDTERVMAYRALVAARGDAKSPLPSVDENLYAANADVSSRSLENILEEFKAVRESNLKFFETVSEEASMFIADGPVSARAIAYILLGHTMHHLNILNERYIALK